MGSKTPYFSKLLRFIPFVDFLTIDVIRVTANVSSTLCGLWQNQTAFTWKYNYEIVNDQEVRDGIYGMELRIICFYNVMRIKFNFGSLEINFVR